MIRPKFEVGVKIKIHCVGCGIAYFMESIMEPMIFTEKGLETMAYMITDCTQSLIKGIEDCKECKKKMKQTHLWG